MGRKIGFLAVMWFAIIFVYIILAITITPVIALKDVAVDTISASSNVSNYPGTIEFFDFFPVLAWFIPGAVGLVATAVILKRSD